MSFFEPDQIGSNLEQISVLPLEEQLAEFAKLREQLEAELNGNGGSGFEAGK
jgi:hypothetical protein